MRNFSYIIFFIIFTAQNTEQMTQELHETGVAVERERERERERESNKSLYNFHYLSLIEKKPVGFILLFLNIKNSTLKLFKESKNRFIALSVGIAILYLRPRINGIIYHPFLFIKLIESQIKKY